MRNKVVVIAIAAIATGVLAGVVIAGGGDDGSPSTDVTVPELKPPPGDLSGTTGDEGTTGDQGTTGDTTTTTTPDSTGGAEAPTDDTGSGQSGGANAPEDTQQEDTPPPQGSPAERFEQFCNDNPGAC